MSSSPPPAEVAPEAARAVADLVRTAVEGCMEGLIARVDRLEDA